MKIWIVMVQSFPALAFMSEAKARSYVHRTQDATLVSCSIEDWRKP